MRRTAFVPGMTALAATGLVLTACTGGGGDATPAASKTGSGGASASANATGTIRFLVGQPDDPADVPLLKADIKKFESQNSGAKVQLTILPNDNLRTVLQTQLRSGNGPDVFGYDTGPGFAGVLARAGLLYDLTPAYAKYKWTIYDWAKQRVTFNQKVLGIPDQVEELGIYYNKKIFEQNGITQPTNLAELQAAADKLKSKRIIPITYSDKEGWEGGHMLSAPLSSMVGASGMQALFAGKKPWNSPEVTQAIDLFFVKFREKGYLPKSPNALNYDNSNALFYSGKAAMNPTGTWLAKDIQSTVKFPVGFMPFPAADGPGIPAAGLGSGIFVSAKTKNPDLALKFLDYLHTPEHGRYQVETYNTIPAYPVDTAGIKASPLFTQILADTSKIAAGQGAFGYNIDVLTSEVFNKAMGDGLQAVLSGKKTAQQCADDLEKAFKKGGSA